MKCLLISIPNDKKNRLSKSRFFYHYRECMCDFFYASRFSEIKRDFCASGFYVMNFWFLRIYVTGLGFAPPLSLPAPDRNVASRDAALRRSVRRRRVPPPGSDPGRRRIAPTRETALSAVSPGMLLCFFRSRRMSPPCGPMPVFSAQRDRYGREIARRTFPAARCP